MTLSEGESIKSRAAVVEQYTLIVVGMTTYQMSGGSPNVEFTLETSDDGEIWADIGSAIATVNQTGLEFGTRSASSTAFGRMVRVSASATGSGTTAEFAVGLSLKVST